MVRLQTCLMISFYPSTLYSRGCPPTSAPSIHEGYLFWRCEINKQYSIILNQLIVGSAGSDAAWTTMYRLSGY